MNVRKFTDLASLNSARKRIWIIVICSIYLVLAGVFATESLDEDEFSFIREPYEILGGDYTMGYLHRQEYTLALKTLVKSYYFFWYYRPLNAPVIGEDHRSMFRRQEREFGYVKPPGVQFDDPTAITKYHARLIVPEPERFYTHGAGKPLLPALLSVPQLAFLKIIGIDKDRILNAQYIDHSDLLFIVIRLVQILAGLASILLVFRIIEIKMGSQKAVLGALVFAIFPSVVKYFPNLHYDAILVPFVLLTVYLRIAKRYAAAGVAYGLALASKNLAIILAPALVADVAIRGLRLWNEAGSRTALTFLRTRLTGLAVMGAVAFVTLLPFANPVSYAEEILTPVISRPIDVRGEDVSQWTLKGIVSHQRDLSPQVRFAQKWLYFNDLGFLFLVLMLCLAIQRPLTSTSRLSIIMILTYLPISSIFGLLLDWRTLLIMPFFSIAAAELLQVSQLRWLAVATAVLALIYVSDPSKTDAMHKQQHIEYQYTGKG